MPDPFPAAIPWYRSTVLRGLLTIAATQIVARLQTKCHIDVSVLGVDVNAIVSWLMDVIAAGALAYVAHKRVTQKVSPIITATQTAADELNTEIPVGATHDKPSPAAGSDTPPSV